MQPMLPVFPDLEYVQTAFIKPGFHMIAVDRPRLIAIVRSYGNQSRAICDRNESHNILNSDSRFNASYQQSNCLFVNMAGVEQGNFNNEEFIEEVNMGAFTTATFNTSKTKTKSSPKGKKSWRNLIYRRRRRRSISATYELRMVVI